ncbi:MAG: hypothetical protein NTY47_00455 [Candidatus Omnitrophica bacterium]|nr:hypothetical protein [Candidatus Omnitrophota bacterium]
MRKFNKIFIILNFLSIAFCCLAASALAQDQTYSSLSAEENNTPQVEQSVSNNPEGLLRPKAEYEAGTLRDPFIQVNEQVPSATTQQATQQQPRPDLRVSGIIWGGVFPQAIINDKVVKVGDVVDGVTILEINKDYINVSYSGVKSKLNSPALSQEMNKNEGGRQ